MCRHIHECCSQIKLHHHFSKAYQHQSRMVLQKLRNSITPSFRILPTYARTMNDPHRHLLSCYIKCKYRTLGHDVIQSVEAERLSGK